VRDEVQTISGNDTARLMLCLLAFTKVSEADGASELGVCWRSGLPRACETS